MLPTVLYDFNCYVGENDFVGLVKEIVFPELVKRMVTLDNGGTSAQIKVPVGWEEIKNTMIFSGAPRRLLTLLQNHNITNLEIQLIGKYIDPNTGTETDYTVEMTGTLMSVKPGTAKKGENADTTVEFCATYIKCKQPGLDDFVIDCLSPFKVSR